MKPRHPEKSPLNGTFPEKAPSMEGEKAPSMAEGKAPSYYLPQGILGIVSEREIRDLIISKNQSEWASKKRIAGVLLILDYFARKGGVVSMSSEL